MRSLLLVAVFALSFGCIRSPIGIGDTTRVGATPKSPGVERTVVGVTGCSQKAVYLVECVVDSCNALLNADTQPAR